MNITFRDYLPKVEIKNSNVKADGKSFFDQPRNNDTKTYENVRKTATGKGDDYTTGCLLENPYLKEQALDADPRAIQQINFTANLDRAGDTTMFLIIEEAEETVLESSQGTVKVFQMCYRM